MSCVETVPTAMISKFISSFRVTRVFLFDSSRLLLRRYDLSNDRRSPPPKRGLLHRATAARRPRFLDRSFCIRVTSIHMYSTADGSQRVFYRFFFFIFRSQFLDEYCKYN